MAKTLAILNDPPYGSERSYNGLHLGLALLKTQDEEVHVFLMGDAAACAKQGQQVTQGYYNVADMLSMLARRGAQIGACGTCMSARGITDAELLEGAHHSRCCALPGAINVPIDTFESFLTKLPKDKEVIAYCRGPYCLMPYDAVEKLRERGWRARLLQDGFPEWCAAGLPVERGVRQ